MTMRPILNLLLGGLLLGLSACGGGGGGAGGGGRPSVTNISANPVQFGRTMVVSVSGFELADGAIQLDVSDGGCEELTTVTGGTETQQQFTCKVANLGALRPKVRDAEGKLLAELSLNVPMPQVTMRMTQGTRTGTFVVELDPGAARSTVRNFLDYVNAGFYTSTLMHRVEQDVVAQGGLYTNNAQRTAKTALFPPIKLQADNGLKHLKYSIAMFHGADADSATSEFFLNLKDNPRFDVGVHPQGYTVFGKVVSGFEIVDEFSKLPGRTVPLEEPFAFLPDPVVVISSVVQTR